MKEKEVSAVEQEAEDDLESVPYMPVSHSSDQPRQYSDKECREIYESWSPELKSELFSKYLANNFENKDCITITSKNKIQQRWFRFRAPKKDEYTCVDNSDGYKRFYRRNTVKMLKDIFIFSAGNLLDGVYFFYNMFDYISKEDNLATTTIKNKYMGQRSGIKY